MIWIRHGIFLRKIKTTSPPSSLIQCRFSSDTENQKLNTCRCSAMKPVDLEVVAFRNGLRGTQGKVGVSPDITVIGKFIGEGLPVGAVDGPEEIVSVFKVSGEGPRVLHSGTFSGNPLTLAAGVAAMRLLTDGLFERFAALSHRLCEGMASILDVHRVDARLEQYCTGSTKLVFGSEPIRNWRDLHAYYQRHQRGKVAPCRML